MHRETKRCSKARGVPIHDRYKIVFIFDIEVSDIEVSEEHKRIVAVDFGVNNLMAVTNNIGAECLLYKSNIIKSFNQYYNKKVSKIMSEEMNKPSCPKNKDGGFKFVPTKPITLLFKETIKYKTSCERQLVTLSHGA